MVHSWSEGRFDCGEHDSRGIEGCATTADSAPMPGAIVLAHNQPADWLADEFQCDAAEKRTTAHYAGRAARSAAEVMRDSQRQATKGSGVACLCESRITSVAGLRPAPDRLSHVVFAR